LPSRGNKKHGTKACLAAADFIKRWIRSYTAFQAMGKDCALVHDALAALYLVIPLYTLMYAKCM